MNVIEGEPVCQERPRVISRGGKSWAYDPSAKEKKALGMALLAHRKDILEGDLWLDIEFFVGKGRKRVDLDNLVKGFLDAANGILFRDDSQIVKITAFLWRNSDRPSTEFDVMVVSDIEIKQDGRPYPALE